MKRKLVVSLIMTVVAASSALAQTTIACISPDSGTAAISLGNLRSLASGSTESDSLFRGGLFPRVSADSVTLVSDAQVCDSAARARAARLGPGSPVESVWVIAVGPTRYVVFSERTRAKGQIIFSVFDTAFTWLADIL